MNLGVQLTANHMGFFEFRLCPHNQPNKPVTNECLDQNVLQKADGSGTRWVSWYILILSQIRKTWIALTHSHIFLLFYYYSYHFLCASLSCFIWKMLAITFWVLLYFYICFSALLQYLILQWTWIWCSLFVIVDQCIQTFFKFSSFVSN